LEPRTENLEPGSRIDDRFLVLGSRFFEGRMDDMYREVILDHYKHPHNAGTLEHPDVSHEDNNQLCGDRIRIDLQIADGIITDARFQGRGCAISQASASLLTDEIIGKPVQQVAAFGRDEMLDLIGIPLDK